MATKSVIHEVQEITLAIELIELGARLQLLEAETGLSRDRLVRLYKEIRGESPPKGMLPFSADWFMTWQPNIHATLFYNAYRFISTQGGCAPIHAIAKSYRLYLEHVQMHGEVPMLSLTRAWTLVRYFSSGLLQMTPCTRCGGRFVAHAHDPQRGFVCGLCQPPSRAGKTRRAAQPDGETVAAVALPAAAAGNAHPDGAASAELPRAVAPSAPASAEPAPAVVRRPSSPRPAAARRAPARRQPDPHSDDGSWSSAA